MQLAKSMTDILKGEKSSRYLGPFLPTLAVKQLCIEVLFAYAKAPVLMHFDPARPI